MRPLRNARSALIATPGTQGRREDARIDLRAREWFRMQDEHNRPPGTFFYSVHAQLLPFLGEDVLYNQINFARPQKADSTGVAAANTTAAGVRVEVFLCPSDVGASGGHPGNNYRCNKGPGPNGSTDPDDTDGDKGAFPSRAFVRLGDFTDGLHSTAAMSEKVIGSFRGSFQPPTDVMLLPVALSSPPTWPTAAQWAQYCRNVPPGARFRTDQGATWLIADNIYTTYNHTVGPNSEIVDCGRDTHPRRGLFPARSRHPGVVNLLLMDGAVRPIGNSVDMQVWRAFSTRSASDSTGTF